MNTQSHPLFPGINVGPNFTWTRKNWADGIELAVENTGYLEIESGDDAYTLSPKVTVAFWCDEPKPGIERRVDVLSVTVFGFTIYQDGAPADQNKLSASDLQSITDWCRAVADYQLVGRDA